MSEMSFRTFNEVFSVGAELLYAVCLALFLRPFLGDRSRRSLPAACLAYLVPRLLCSWADAPRGVFGLLLTAMLTAAAGVLGLERATALLLALLYWNARTSSGLMVESLYFIAERLLPSPMEPLEAVYLRAVLLILLFLLSHAALLVVMLYIFQRQMRKQRLPLYRRELCCLSLIPAAGILFGQIISKLLIEFKDGVLLQLYERHPAFLAAVPLLALLFCAGTCLTIAFQQGLAALREEQAAHFMEQQQIQAIQARIQEAEQFYTRIRRMKHEMRGHLTNIKGLVRSGEYAGLEDYITRVDESIGSFEFAVQTGNPVTDVVVNDKRQRCLASGIRFQADFHYPEAGGYQAFDVGIILQNLLQNALEACERVREGERFVLLTGRRKGRFFLIEVRNSCEGNVVFGPDGLPVTTKQEDPLMHGFGFSNVRREAEKYMGELELKAGPQEFSATVLLQERSGL